MPRVPGAPRGGRSAKRKQRRELAWKIAEQFWRILSLWAVDQPRLSYQRSSSSSSVPSRVVSTSVFSWKESAERQGLPFRSRASSRTVKIEIEDGSGEEEIEPFDLPDIATIRNLSEVADCVDELRFNLPDHIGGGVCLVNKKAFQGLETGDFSDDNEIFAAISEALRPSIVFDLFKTVVFPARLANWDYPQVILAEHRGEKQVIDQRVAKLLQEVSTRGYRHCAISFIGRSNSERYIDSLSEAAILSLIPVVFIVFRRESKANVASSIQAFVCFDDQQEVVDEYRRAGIDALRINHRVNPLTDTDEVLRFLSLKWNQSPPQVSDESRYIGKAELRFPRL